MPVPDFVIFGPATIKGGHLNYGDVRKLDAEARLKALKLRIDTFLIKQTEELAKVTGKKMRRKVNSPFPLFLLTCVAIETSGKIFFTPKATMPELDRQREGFLKFCGKFDAGFAKELSQQEKIAFDLLWGAGQHKEHKTISKIVYKVGRHTMVHAFRGKGVFLTEGIEKWQFVAGALELNPYWFWQRFRELYDEEWSNLFKEKEANGALKRSASAYLEELLS
jgi:hypothetical protein